MSYGTKHTSKELSGLKPKTLVYVVHEKIIITARFLEGRGRDGGCLHISVKDK